MWLFPGWFKPAEGLPLGRFDRQGLYRSTQLVAVPQFDDMKKAPGGVFSNPTGHLVIRSVVPALSRLFLVDYDKQRLVWFSIKEFEQ